MSEEHDATQAAGPVVDGEADASGRPGHATIARVVVAALVAAVIAASVIMAYVPGTAGDTAVWGPSWAVSTTDLFAMRPRTGVRLVDEEIYLGTLRGVEQGTGFYRANGDMFALNPGRWDTHSPLTYRQPLLTYLWVALGSGMWIGVAFGVLAGASMVAAYRAAESLVRPVYALLTPAALGLVYALGITHPPRLLYAELWAAPMVVTAAALCSLVLTATARPDPDVGRLRMLGALGATVALLAMATRELAAIPVAFMLAALLLDRGSRAHRTWVPWAASIVVWAALYTVHVGQVRAVSQGDPAPAVPQADLLLSYFHPGADFIAACVRWVSTTPALVPVVAILCVMALAGVVTLRTTGLRVLVGGMTLGLLLLLVFTGTPGTFRDGSYTGYWGFLFLPPVIAWASLGMRLLPGGSTDETVRGQTPSDEETVDPRRG